MVDNASTGKTRDIVKEVHSELITLHEFESYESIAEKNHSRCMRIGSGKYRAVYHSDDIYYKAMVETAVEFFEKNDDIDAISTRAIFINPEGEEIGASKTFKQLRLPEKEK